MENKMSEAGGPYIAALDVGTTTVRCHVFDSQARTVSSASKTVTLLYPRPGFVEIDPDKLWQDVRHVVRQALSSAPAGRVECLGMSTQRSTWVTWGENGEMFHNFVTWKDTRADGLIDEFNRSVLMKLFRLGAYCLYLLTGNARYLAGTHLRATNSQVRLRTQMLQSTMKLVWAIQNVPALKRAVASKTARFGTLDTWLIYKLTGGRTYVTDVSSASATGFYDPFVLDWASWPALTGLPIPFDMLPEVVPNDYDFGHVDEAVFGTAVPIKCSISDQSASMFGSCCFEPHDLKLTLGTGAFLDVNTGRQAMAGIEGTYPIVGWKLTDGYLAYVSESPCGEAGPSISWAQRIGLVASAQETAVAASQVGDSDGVYFVPPCLKNAAAAVGNLGPCLIGIKPTNTGNHVVRAILETIVYKVNSAYGRLIKDTGFDTYGKLCIDGGVSNNDFVCQSLADLTRLDVERPASTEMTALGVAFVAGLKTGMWKDRDTLRGFRRIDQTFKPTQDGALEKKYLERYEGWMDASERIYSDVGIGCYVEVAAFVIITITLIVAIFWFLW